MRFPEPGRVVCAGVVLHRLSFNYRQHGNIRQLGHIPKHCAEFIVQKLNIPFGVLLAFLLVPLAILFFVGLDTQIVFLGVGVIIRNLEEEMALLDEVLALLLFHDGAG